MDNLRSPNDSFELDVYKNAIKRFEQLYTAVQSHHLKSNGPLVSNLIQQCNEYIGILLNLQLKSTSHEAMTDFDQDIHGSLLTLENYLCRLENRLQPTSKPSSSIVHLSNTSKTISVEGSKFVKTTPKVKGLCDIAGLVEVKRALTTLVLLPLHQPQLYSGGKISNSLLLFGPPGTGKTLIAHAIAAEASASFFSISSSDIVSSYVGATEKALSGLFERVRQETNCTILFFDEIDGICQKRHSNENEWSRRLKTELMTQLSKFEDSPNKFLICATNCPWDLDSAILRRFQTRIYIPLPNRHERLELLKLLTEDIPLENLVLWDIVVENTEGYSGSDLTDLIRNAKNCPITELLDTNIWQRTADNTLVPARLFGGMENLVRCKLSEVPYGCAQARPMEIHDVMEMLKTVRPTIPLEQIAKYNKFVNQ
ncbi:hypothetical protein PPYR_00247 [Photinus pyralis]|uniref:AAA+ ATPase domain-containing protein n=2 Tax=Photinus pyralis TaxID=7054 RepID=A0A5N4B103_PHOPY|nr:suppressor protein of bem1/bed5 double mutants-like [Photinus pyralis]KAB0803277.1 hypothetical protein PPYR_00247 [Photinus pyralis]